MTVIALHVVMDYVQQTKILSLAQQIVLVPVVILSVQIKKMIFYVPLIVLFNYAVMEFVKIMKTASPVPAIAYRVAAIMEFAKLANILEMLFSLFSQIQLP